MINLNELRVGNWVQYDDGAPGMVYEILTQNLVLSRPSQPISFSVVSPIILTPEILVICGFKPEAGRNGYEYWYPHDESIWSIRREKNGKWRFCILESDGWLLKLDPIIESLHWLQNMHYFLTGKELTVNF